MDKATEIFEQCRKNLLQLAYSILGRVSVSEDIVQEAYLKWKDVDLDTVSKPESYLSSIVTNLCLDRLKSAQHKREKYIGPDLPEPIATKQNTPEAETQLADSLSMAMMYVLKKLNPVQRAVFILREVFSYPYSDIAGIVNKSEANCRKIAQRARNKINYKSNRFSVDAEAHQKLLKSFMEAVQQEDMEQLESLLAEEATLYSDGGGQVTAARKPIYGADKIARFMVGIQNNAPENTRITYSNINGEPSILVYFGDRLHSVWTFRTTDSTTIKEILVVLNPNKLEQLKQ